MAINFPTTPTLNQTYTFNGRTWTYNGVGWQATGASGLSVYTKTTFTATAAQTTFTVAYTVGFVDVYYNGSKLSITEYTATNGTSVVLGTACALNDIVETVAWTVSTTLNPALGVATATSLAIGGATIGSNALAVTGTTQLNSALNYGGVTLSNAVTGTGNMVLSASPTFTGTALASKLRVAGGVGGNSLVVDKAGSSANRLQIFVGDGTGGTTADENYIANNNTGLHFWGGATGNTEFMTLTNTGLLGIGMTPSNVLDITQTANSASYARIQNASAGSSAAVGWQITNNTSSSYAAVFGGSFTPSGMARADGFILQSGGAGGLSFNTVGAVPIYFGINNAEVARFDTSGNFLLATTSTPTSKLGVQGDAIFSNGGNVLNAGGAVNFSANGVNFNPMASIKGLLVNTSSGDDQGNLAFYTRPSGGAGQVLTERLRINDIGHLIVGTATDTGHVNVGGSVACFSGGTANVASNIMMDFSGGVGRIQGYGPNASTNGSLSFSSCRSDGSNPLTMSLGTTGVFSVNANMAAFYGPASGTGYSAQFYNSPTGSQDIYIEQANGTASGTTGTMRISKTAVNDRSINATGTINASGADYAEYMVKAAGCGSLTKGDIVGIDADGKLTDKYADAHSFVIKSTNPSYVGGDNWSDENPAVGPRPEPTSTEDEAEKAVLEAELVKWKERHEAARATVDRIAFSGQVPVNVTGATVGDYIVPVAGPDGGIAGEAVTNPTFDQYRAAVGRVWKILEDGRAFVSVKVS